MHRLYELKDMICDELKNQAEKGLTRENLDLVDKLAHAGKNVDKLIKSCEVGASYAMPDGSYDGSMVGYRNSYGQWTGGANGREGSYARGRMRAARDSMGRYSGSEYSREEGYSRNSEFADELKRMAMNLPENFRGEILRMAEKMKSVEG